MRRLFALCFVLVLILFLAAPLFAQDGGHAAATPELCIAYGAIIAVAVSLLKRIPFGLGKWIAKNPKTCAAFLSAIGGLAPFLAGKNLTIAQLATCVAAYFAGSIGTYETLIKPVGKAFVLDPDPS